MPLWSKLDRATIPLSYTTDCSGGCGTLRGQKEKKKEKKPQPHVETSCSPHPFLPVWGVGCRAQNSGSYFVTRRPPARGLKETGGEAIARSDRFFCDPIKCVTIEHL